MSKKTVSSCILEWSRKSRFDCVVQSQEVVEGEAVRMTEFKEMNKNHKKAENIFANLADRINKQNRYLDTS